ncbi:MAG: hypothetical protein ACRC2V_01215 [Xenococcaceae cyanobacterium]
MIKQLSLLDTEMYQASQSQVDWEIENSGCTDSISNPKHLNHVDIESKCTTNGTINIYYGGGTSRGEKKYYRFSWREKNRMCHRHISGGNIDSQLAKKRAALVQCEIDLGRTPSEIVKYIKSFGRTTK